MIYQKFVIGFLLAVFLAAPAFAQDEESGGGESAADVEPGGDAPPVFSDDAVDEGDGGIYIPPGGGNYSDYNDEYSSPSTEGNMEYPDRLRAEENDRTRSNIVEDYIAQSIKNTEKPVETTPKNFFMQLKFAAFWPENFHLKMEDQDRSFDIPYSDFYGKDYQPMVLFEAAYTPLTNMTNIGIGGGFGATYAEGKALKFSQNSLKRTDNKITLLVAPAYLSLFWDFQFIDEQWVVPGISAGLDLWGWNETKDQGGDDLWGYVYGWHAEAHIWLLLDGIERKYSRKLDTVHGINHSYLVFEYRYNQIDSFGSADLDFSSQTLGVGIGVVF